jgi:hypothetical protein
MEVYRSTYNQTTRVMPGMGVVASLSSGVRGWTVTVRLKSPLWGTVERGWEECFNERATANAAFESIQRDPDGVLERHLGEARV